MRTEFMGYVRVSEVCVLCGREQASTKEHVPARGFFKTQRTDHLTVPSCESCNNGSSKDDELVRAFIAATSGTQAGLRIWKHVARSSMLTRLRSMASWRRVDEGAFGIGNAMVIEVPAEPVRRVGRKICAALYWLHTGAVLPAPDTTNVTILTARARGARRGVADYEALQRRLAAGAYVDPTVIRTFSYRYRLEPDESCWFLKFFDDLELVCVTGSGGLLAEVDRALQSER